MSLSSTVAIIGGGPAGSVAAACLARGGRRVLLFDEKLAWEKPCGGGITHKALEAWPLLRHAQVERNWIERCELTSPQGRTASFQLDQPVAIFSRRVLNGVLLDDARQAGAEIIQARVLAVEQRSQGWELRLRGGGYEASQVILAAGARNPFRPQFCQPFSPDDLMATAGYYIPGTSRIMQIVFLPGLHGYIWIFPRTGHLSAGICGKLGGKSTAQLRALLESELSKLRLDFTGAQFYSHLLPSLQPATLQGPVCGPGWAMIGDAAGFVDPVTGEGLYYAMRSGELAARAELSGHPEAYGEMAAHDFLPELEAAARIADRFYEGRWMGDSVIERMVQFTAHSPSFRDLMRDMFSGTQGYVDLRRRLYRGLPRMLAEGLASALGLAESERQEPHAA